MPRPEAKPNLSASHGRWGEAVAVELLRRKGYEILERNVRPSARDRRLEIDVIAYDKARDLIVFVEVKQHRVHSAFERRLRSVDRRKKRLLRSACRAWLAKERWEGSFRFDVVEVYGEPGAKTRVETDHIERVNLFAPEGRFVNWSE